MERQARSNVIKLIFADDESDVSSTICEDQPTKDELTNPNLSKTMDTSENGNVSILGSEGVAKNVQKLENGIPVLISRN